MKKILYLLTFICLSISVLAYYPLQNVNLPAYYLENGAYTEVAANITIKYPNSTIYIDNKQMNETSIGNFIYSLQLPNTVGLYTIVVNYLSKVDSSVVGHAMDLIDVQYDYTTDINTIKQIVVDFNSSCNIDIDEQRINATDILVSITTSDIKGTLKDYSLNSTCYDTSGLVLNNLNILKLSVGEYKSLYTTASSGICFIYVNSSVNTTCAHNNFVWHNYYSLANGSMSYSITNNYNGGGGGGGGGIGYYLPETVVKKVNYEIFNNYINITMDPQRTESVNFTIHNLEVSAPISIELLSRYALSEYNFIIQPLEQKTIYFNVSGSNIAYTEAINAKISKDIYNYDNDSISIIYNSYQNAPTNYIPNQSGTLSTYDTIVDFMKRPEVLIVILCTILIIIIIAVSQSEDSKVMFS